MATAGLILINIFFYIGFALWYQPPSAMPPTQTAIQDAGENIAAYFHEHKISKYSETLIGDPQEPIGFIFLAADDSVILKDFETAGWHPADKINIGQSACASQTRSTDSVSRCRIKT